MTTGPPAPSSDRVVGWSLSRTRLPDHRRIRSLTAWDEPGVSHGRAIQAYARNRTFHFACELYRPYRNFLGIPTLPKLSARFSLEVSSPCLLALPEDQVPEVAAQVDDFRVAAKLLPREYWRAKMPGDVNLTTQLGELEIEVSQMPKNHGLTVRSLVCCRRCARSSMPATTAVGAAYDSDRQVGQLFAAASTG